MDRRISWSDRDARIRATIRKGGSRSLLFALTALLALSLFPMGAAAQDDWSAPRTVYIPETGHTVDGVFLDTWREWGGASAFGNPITPEIEENGRIVQYYEYARFEYVPDDPNGQVVHFGQIGRELKPTTVFRSKPQLWTTGEQNGLEQIADELRAWAPVTGSEARIPDSPTRRYVDRITAHYSKWVQGFLGSDRGGQTISATRLPRSFAAVMRPTRSSSAASFPGRPPAE